ncbi:Ras GTPase-activating protein-binding protein 1 [Nymphon striatum]|nr:Ras GTPase-activating protein-binding protein 1 [Nymphon striatum]
MVMESPTPQCVGKEFVRQYYTMLNQAPLHLHRFYSHNSSFIHGGIDPDGHNQPVMGQQDIHRRIMQLNFRDCHAKIRQVDSHSTISNAVVVQVTGELSNNGQPMRRFMQTFVLALQSPKKYYVLNDIFRYQDEVFSDEEGDEEQTCNVDSEQDEEQELLLQDDTAVPVQDSTVSNSMYYENQPVSNGTAHVENLDRVTPPRLMSDSPTGTEVDQPQIVSTENFQAAEEEQAEETPASVESEEAVSKDNQLYDVKADDKSDESPSPAEPATQSSQPELKTYANIVGRSTNAPLSTINTTAISSGPVVDGFKPFPSQQQSVAAAAAIQKPDFNPSKEFPSNNNAAVPNSVPNTNNPRIQRHRGNMSNRGRDNRPVPPNRDRDDSTGDSKDRRAYTGPPNVTYPDSVQVFVGNLPHVINEDQLKEYFSQWGPVKDIRINTKQINKLGNNSKQPPNFGFIVFENEDSVKKVLDEKKPILYQNNHRLNVEVKKTKQRNTMMMGGPPLSDMRGMNDGRPNSGRGGMGRMQRGGVRLGSNVAGNRGRGFVNSRR